MTHIARTKSRDELISDITHFFSLEWLRKGASKVVSDGPSPAGNTGEKNHQKLLLPLSEGSESDDGDDSDDEDGVEMAVSVTDVVTSPQQ